MKLLSNNLNQITTILNDLNFHDGDNLGNKLGITRSAVWKTIKKLVGYGIEINSIKNKGYQLKEPLILLDQEEITKGISNPDIKIEVFEDIDSTNNYLKKQNDSSQRRICFAETQHSGRGRMGRNWNSPFGQNIYMSYAYNFKKDISELSGLSLIVGIATLIAFKEIGIDSPIKLKWPNDGVYDAHKLIGILVELQSEANGESRAIIGIGINVNMLVDSSSSITQNWTSLRKITGNYIDRNKLSVALIHNLNTSLELFSKYGLREFMGIWHNLDTLYNQQITINNGEKTGIAKGINEQGNLLLELKSGEVVACSSGETSILKK